MKTHPTGVYVGLTLRKGKQEVNVHSVKDGMVYFGIYHDEAEDAAEHCTGLYWEPLDEFQESLEYALNHGATVQR